MGVAGNLWSTHFLEVRKWERRWMQRWLHDELGSLLTALTLQFQLLEMDLKEGLPVQRRLWQLREMLQAAADSVKEFSEMILPNVCNAEQLARSLRQLAQFYSRSLNKNVRVVRCTGLNHVVEARLEGVYWIACELIELVYHLCPGSDVAISISNLPRSVNVSIRTTCSGKSMSNHPWWQEILQLAERQGLKLQLSRIRQKTAIRLTMHRVHGARNSPFT